MVSQVGKINVMWSPMIVNGNEDFIAVVICRHLLYTNIINCSRYS